MLPHNSVEKNNAPKQSTIRLQWLAGDILKIATDNFTYQYFHLDENLMGKKIFVSHDFLNIDFIKHALSDLVTNDAFKIEYVDDNNYFINFSPKYPANCHIRLLVNNQDYVCDIDQINTLMQNSDNLNKENTEILLTLFYREILKANIINNKLNHKYEVYDINKEFAFELITNTSNLNIKNALVDSKMSVYFDIVHKIDISQKDMQEFKTSNKVVSEKLKNVTPSNNNFIIQPTSVVKVKKYPSPDCIQIFLSNHNVKIQGRLTVKDKFTEDTNDNIKINIPLLLKNFNQDFVFTFPFYIQSQIQIGYMNVKRDDQFYGGIIFEIAIRQQETKCKLYLTPISYYADSSTGGLFPIVDGIIEGGNFRSGGGYSQTQFIPDRKYCFLFQCEEMVYLGDLYDELTPMIHQQSYVKHFSFIQFELVFDI